MDISHNLYAILGLSPEAAQEDIRDAYRVLARRFHPDANRNEGADVLFRDIATAYEVLGDPTQRVRYDARRHREADEPNYFSLRVTPSKRILPTLGEPQVFYLLVEIVPMRHTTQQGAQQTPLNLVLVLDRSTSMRGQRLDKVKIAARQIIDQLGPQDILSVVAFSDRADVLIEAGPVTDPAELRATVSIMRAGGGTEIYHGLAAGIEQCRKHLGPHMVNHVILLTDGRTFGDEERSLSIAKEATKKGISISAMGIGDEWNDVFLDALAATSGGTSAYINSPAAVVRFLNDRVRSLGEAFVERLQLTVAPDADVTFESAFKLHPTPQPLTITPQPIPIGVLEKKRPSAVLLQLQMPPSNKDHFRTVVRLDVTGDVLTAKRTGYKVISDISVEIAESPGPEDPPAAILDALGKLTLYRMQQKAEQAIQQGDIVSATRRLENLATRLLAAGQEELAQVAKEEARRVSQTRAFSEEGRKGLKFGTRMLLALPEPREDGGA